MVVMYLVQLFDQKREGKACKVMQGSNDNCIAHSIVNTGE